MLCYLGKGPRYYTADPIPVIVRRYWEFQAVLSGRIAMVGPDGPGPLRERQLWLSSPGHSHGWTGDGPNPAEIAVFHFLSVPEHLARKVPEPGCREVHLEARQIDRLRELAQLVERHWRRPGPGMLLRHEHALLELSLLATEALGGLSNDAEDAARIRVQKALDWFSAHMEKDPGLDQVAKASGSSASHLRRHFYDVMQAPPKKIFDQLRFQRAMQMMADPETKLSAVGAACGFKSPSAFSRAFKTKFGISPEKWRG
jgi:AraC family transcriptional regulator